jgi:NAD dependent epimerase/dehydratase family enzyme
VPGFALRTAVGEFADYLLHGRRVVPRKLHELGFAWTHATLAGALAASS